MLVVTVYELNIREILISISKPLSGMLKSSTVTTLLIILERNKLSSAILSS